MRGDFLPPCVDNFRGSKDFVLFSFTLNKDVLINDNSKSTV